MSFGCFVLDRFALSFWLVVLSFVFFLLYRYHIVCLIFPFFLFLLPVDKTDKQLYISLFTHAILVSFIPYTRASTMLRKSNHLLRHHASSTVIFVADGGEG